MSVRMQYNSTLFYPPCPVLDVTVSAPVGGGFASTLVAQVDTGADVCVIPTRIVRSLSLVPYRTNSIQEHDGRITRKEVYRVRLTMGNVASIMVDCVNYQFLDSDDYMILGREALNQLRLLLDGPAQDLSFQ